MSFWGFSRPDGSVGTRNHVGVISTVTCANDIAQWISDQVPGCVHFTHQQGCGHSRGSSHGRGTHRSPHLHPDYSTHRHADCSSHQYASRASHNRDARIDACRTYLGTHCHAKTR